MTQPHAEVTSKTFNWLIQRPDGVGFALTSHDRPQAEGNVTFDPSMDLRPADMVIQEEMLGSRLDVGGGLSNAALTQDDLLSGRWKGANVELQSRDWVDKQSADVICRGQLGDVKGDQGKIAMAVDLLPPALRRSPCVQTSPECRAILGDQQCRVDMRTRRRRVVVASAEDQEIQSSGTSLERFALGRLRWVSGMNSGLEQTIISVDGSKLILQDIPFHTVEVNDKAILTEGCDGRRSTCSERFHNILNFRGEPDLPGSEILMRFPGA